MFQCIESTKPCCRLEDRTSVQFGRKEYICDRFFGGLCAPLDVINNLTLYKELSAQLNETNLAELSNLYFQGIKHTLGIKPEPKIEDAGKVEEVVKQSTDNMKLSTEAEREPGDKTVSGTENWVQSPDTDSPINNKPVSTSLLALCQQTIGAYAWLKLFTDEYVVSEMMEMPTLYIGIEYLYLTYHVKFN